MGHQTSDTVTPLVFASKILQILREKEADQQLVTMGIKFMSSVSFLSSKNNISWQMIHKK